MFVYILSNFNNTVLYIGVTNNLERRILEHKSLLVQGFTQTYKVTKLVYFEFGNSPDDAIAREKQLKGRSRSKKEKLIYTMNPEMKEIFVCE